MTHRTPCTDSAHDRARRLMTHRTPCTHGADDRARIFVTHRTPCIESADDRARILMTHRTPCTSSVHDRARIFLTHRTPCTESADDRADKHCTPCTSSEASPRARTALCGRGSLPLRALLGRLLSQCIFVIDIADIRNVYPDFRPPNRRRHPPPARSAPLEVN